VLVYAYDAHAGEKREEAGSQLQGASDAVAGSIRCVTRTTVDIDASVLRELKRRQERERKTLGRLISELLAQAMAAEDGRRPARPFSWVTKDLAPRIDLEDKDALWSVLDER
jgi:hypothetical protein